MQTPLSQHWSPFQRKICTAESSALQDFPFLSFVNVIPLIQERLLFLALLRQFTVKLAPFCRVTNTK